MLLLTASARGQRVMTLQECIAAARVGNTKAKDAVNNLSIAKEQQKYARTKYFPMVGASAMHFESTDYLLKQKLFSEDFQELIDILAAGSEFLADGGVRAIKHGTSIGITFLEPVYAGGRITNINKLADLQVDAREKLRDVTDDEIALTTEFIYYKVLELHETDKTLDALEHELENIHQDAVNIYENGIVNKNDVLSVELIQDQLSALRIKTQNGCRLLRRTLAKYIGMADEDIDVDTTLSADIVAPEVLRMNTYTAVDNRTETQLLDMWVEKSVLEKKLAKANMRPILLLGGTANYSKFFAEGQTKGIGFVTVQMPLSAFWSERHIYKWKQTEEQKALDFRQDKRELITLQIQDAYDNLESTYKQTQIAEKSVVRAEENLRINREYYRNGLINMSILLDAQRQKQQALTQQIIAVSEYLQAKSRYLILTGRRS
jgi:outer membrane protein TolC